jgi:hypothetical protein
MGIDDIDVTHAPEAIDRSNYAEDVRTISPGETLRVRATFTDQAHDVYLKRQQPDAERIDVGTVGAGEHMRFSAPTEEGYYGAFVAGESVDTVVVGTPGGETGTVEDNPNKGTGDADDWTNVDNSPDIDPADYAGIVNADNDEGIALAPSLRREGASLGPDGATVTLPDGETVDVGAISDADEVARVVEGDDAGDVIDADRPAVDGSSSGGPGDGMIGGAVAVVLLVVAGAAALLGGGD